MIIGGNPARAQGERWCMLRTSGPQTLALARSLVDAGIDAWTPMTIISRRLPRSQQRLEREAPILPTFVFARAEHVPELFAVLAMPLNPHPAFSVFRHAGRIPFIGAASMASLRAVEQQAADERARGQERARLAELKKRGTVPPIGTKVRVANSVAFASMTGVVEGAKGRAALVNFGSGLAFAIDSWLLASDGI